VTGVQTCALPIYKHRITTATTLVGQTLYDTFGVAPQAYFTLQLDSLPDMIDALDGVDINNPVAFTSDKNMYFPAGVQHLNGKQSREFVQTYHPGGDEARRSRQNLFLEGMQATLLNAGLVTQLPDLYNTFNSAITTDLSPLQIKELACMLEVVPTDQIEVHEMAGDLVTPINVSEGVPALLPKVDQAKVKLAEWLGE
jgi:anionic cell wall polymer biosynthesis LytR-Cps2A-Psr (LCP) family protein